MTSIRTSAILQAMQEDTLDKIIAEMAHYAEFAVTGDNEKKLVGEWAARLKAAWEYQCSKRLTCAECGDTTSIREMDWDGVCAQCQKTVEEK